jgi:hypothetical protein
MMFKTWIPGAPVINITPPPLCPQTTEYKDLGNGERYGLRLPWKTRTYALMSAQTAEKHGISTINAFDILLQQWKAGRKDLQEGQL